jgi:DNA polymerase-3 subunit epsilon
MEISRFVCFDVETPNRFNSRMSAIGISVIENGKIISEYYSLVNPEQRFDYFNVKLTGISSRMVKNEKTLPEIWEEIRETMESGLLTAHNASFDMGVLGKCLRDYGIDWKEEVPYICTCQIGKRHLPDQGHKLDELCSYYNIALNHHHADSDASACARILQHYLTEGCDIEDNLRSYDLVACRTKPAGRKGRKKT